MQIGHETDVRNQAALEQDTGFATDLKLIFFKFQPKIEGVPILNVVNVTQIMPP